ncbi:hypothetical protein [Jeotgalibacillus proteolyticus]|uniref:Uncharacterized protein n=1 Tax=Jeotgalibacillus proteolyticus TaxID=2082395 RepID=A0A2S5G6T7_9BACL|nr:hypothetical protein [Jeotgalibacillus proteolyticus]PPA68675.1 hypothetical protein C4B60_19070 [Jeotgalibacillus proteolyticus]PPA68752.1 hypothetical protein C4B60_19500 [Jeotgalibacillus proteolyticus]
MELHQCDYCARRDYKEYVARVKWGVDRFDPDRHPNYYCRKCLNTVIENSKGVPHIKEYGYEVDYPFANNIEKG